MANWFASPAALWLGLLIGPLLLLYMLRHKPVRKRVPSVMLWTGVAQTQVATSPFQRLRRSLSLLLMLLALTALVLALAGFRVPGGEKRGVPLTIVIDVTASMDADARGGKRIDIALEHARRIIDEGGNSDVSVMVWDGNLRALTTGHVEPDVALAALDRVRVVHRGTDDAALVRAMDRISEDATRRFVLVTDHPPGDFRGAVFVAQAGMPLLNAGIVSASLSEITARQIDLFFGLELTGSEKPLTVPFLLERVREDGSTELSDARDITLSPVERTSVTFSGIEPGLYAGRIRLDDGFALDNIAYLRFSRLPVQDVVLTPGTPDSVRRAASAIADSMGVIRLVEPGSEEPVRTAYVLSDSASAGARPRLPAAYLAPDAPPPRADFGALIDVPEGSTRPSASFLWRGAGTPDIRLPKVHEISTEQHLRPALSAGEGPAIALLPRENGLDDLVIAAPLDENAGGFTGKFAFVIFWANWFDYVRRSSEPLPRGAVHTRQTVRVRPMPGREGFEYGPVAAALDASMPGRALRLDEIGVYRFSGLADTSLPLLGVSLLDANESRLSTGDTTYDSQAMLEWMGSYEGLGESRDLALGPWLALLAAGLLLFDWLWFRRRFPLGASAAMRGSRPGVSRAPRSSTRRHSARGRA